MAGQRPTSYDQCARPPCIILPFSFPIQNFDGGTTGGTSTTFLPLFIAPFDLTIDEAILLVNPQDTVTMTLVKVDDGSDPSSVFTAISTTNGVDTSSLLTAFSTPFRTSQGATSADDGSIGPSENIVRRGQMVGLNLSGGFSGFGTTALAFTVRCTGFIK